jgi:diacylglycerol kinase (ATP)
MATTDDTMPDSTSATPDPAPRSRAAPDGDARRVALLVNPERTDVADELERRVSEAGLIVERIQPDGADDLVDAARSAVDDGADVVAAVGGDGTQRAVATAVAGTDAALGVVPGGTVNLLARVLGIESVEDAANAICGGATRAIDIARCNGDAFVLHAGSGYDGEVIHAVDDGAKRFGRVGYTMVGVRELLRRRAHRVSVALDGEPWFDGDAFTVIVLNVGQRGSAELYLAPDATPDDGRLDVVVVRGRPMRQVLRAVWALVRGREPDPDAIAIGQAATIDVTWDSAVPLQLGGDGAGRTDTLHCEIDPARATVCVPG